VRGGGKDGPTLGKNEPGAGIKPMEGSP